MAIIPVSSADHPALAPYRRLRHQNPTRYSKRFIAEGDKLVERLLSSRFTTESVFAAEENLARWQNLVPDNLPIYVAPRPLLEETIGFNFHRGCLACGVRRPATNLDQWSPQRADCTIVVCPDVQDPTNLGAILRNCAAFGVDMVLLGNRCADPFSRRVLRVSMGAVLDLTIVESADLASELTCLQRDYQVKTIATVLETTADSLVDVEPPPRLALLLGSEGHGLAPSWIMNADRCVTIPMQLGTDSLNVAVASGIFLYHFTRPAKAIRS